MFFSSALAEEQGCGTRDKVRATGRRPLLYALSSSVNEAWRSGLTITSSAYYCTAPSEEAVDVEAARDDKGAKMIGRIVVEGSRDKSRWKALE